MQRGLASERVADSAMSKSSSNASLIVVIAGTRSLMFAVRQHSLQSSLMIQQTGHHCYSHSQSANVLAFVTHGLVAPCVVLDQKVARIAPAKRCKQRV